MEISDIPAAPHNIVFFLSVDLWTLRKVWRFSYGFKFL